ncbi:ribonuclease E [Kordiimonas sediminis]|uniref:Ribonuclease E n=1 Tax=Kordiimonas sediminis TaxID=1735581 RepID=A0A919E809_9PROT|nr:ribonuclease E/G [Kordiimonas sediminis]GHF27433.1 ribonuclease E [Kordiimonas sediminis]
MSTRMLIDARHDEETRVTIVKGSRVEDFDYESSTRRQLKGNIYLARVTRVEPSLQAAFVEYGGNRHGFLAFSEIHPDYYQIPTQDRDAIVAEEMAAAKARAKREEEEDDHKQRNRRRRRSKAVEPDEVSGDTDSEDTDVSDLIPDDETDNVTDSEAASSDDEISTSIAEDAGTDEPAIKESEEEEKDQELEDASLRRQSLRALKRRYNIQEVIKKRQVLLIQVVKEERGNKGAALTTYLSLAGRYCVLMANSTHAGGISRKISNGSDRKRLKNIISSLDVPSEMGLIVRTAGLQRTKVEIKRDYDYLVRLWNGIRELTLKSIAPALIYEEGDLIKRTIRDLYTRDIDEILVEGENGYRSAKDFMKLLMPSHSKKVQHYKSRIPLFHRYQVETQLENMYSPEVHLKSGGYIVMNPTEALISIDVNSGRSTKEHSIEETALRTNLEAAEEIARQLRLRDLAGLIVIDFIDMEERANNRAVERRMKEVLKNDRARIQVGRISSFGLMEMSRQRLRPNLLEASTVTCPTCEGAGIVRSLESVALLALRQLEEEGIRARSAVVRVGAHPDIAIYLLNQKRNDLVRLEETYNYRIEILASRDVPLSGVEITREAAPNGQVTNDAASDIVVTPDTIIDVSDDVEEDDVEETVDSSENNSQEERGRRKRRRRRRNRRDRDDNQDQAETSETSSDETDVEVSDSEADKDQDETSEQKEGRSRRRRGRRGGRRRGRKDDTVTEESAETESSPAPEDTGDKQVAEGVGAETDVDAPVDDKPKRRRRVRRKPTEDSAVSTDDAEKASDEKAAETAPADDTAEPANEEKPKRRRRTKKPEASDTDTAAVKVVAETSSDAPEAAVVEETAEKPKRRRRRVKKDEAETANADAVDASSENASPEEKTEEKKPRTRRKAAPKKTAEAAETSVDKADAVEAVAEEKPKPARKPRAKKAKPAEAKAETVEAKAGPKAPKSKVAAEENTAVPASASVESTKKPAESTDDAPDAPKKKGWWNRTFG